MATIACISNINRLTTREALINSIKCKHLHLAIGQCIVCLTSGQDMYQTAVVTFNRALHPHYDDRELNGSHITIDADFAGLVVLSEGSEQLIFLPSIMALHGLNGHAFYSWECR